VRVVEREKVIVRVRTEYREPTAQDCVKRVLESPRACREVMNGLAAKASQGRLHSGAHSATVAAIERLVQAMIDPGIRPIRWRARDPLRRYMRSKRHEMLGRDGAVVRRTKIKDPYFAAAVAK